MLSELTECTVLMLKVIHDLYRKQRITYDEFLNYTEAKLQFLSENIDCIASEHDRKQATDIIHLCSSLISEDNQRVAYLQ